MGGASSSTCFLPYVKHVCFAGKNLRGLCGLLALRWGDVDLEAGTLTVSRSVGVVNSGQGKRLLEGRPKTAESRRMVDLDDETVAVLKAWKLTRATVNLQLAGKNAFVFGTDLPGTDVQSGAAHHPERFARSWRASLARAAKVLELEPIRFHDLRHTHATALLKAGTPPHVVAKRLGHSTPVITMSVYAHVLDGQQRDALVKLAELAEG